MIRVQELREVQSHIDSLKIELTNLQKDIIVKQKKQGELLRLLRAEQQANFQEIDRRLNILYGNISESQNKLSQISKKTLEIKKRWEEKVIFDSLNSVEKSIEIQKIFDIALNDFTTGQYSIALKSFTDITNKYPDSPLAEDSHYWIAECYYVQKKYPDAANRYKEYIKKYNNGSKVCVSLYKLGLIYKRMRQTEAMKLVWNKLIAQCPNSEETQAVKSMEEMRN
jgi:tol-pal system protein YbgF